MEGTAQLLHIKLNNNFDILSTARSLIWRQWSCAYFRLCEFVNVQYKPPVCMTASFRSQPDEASCSVPIASTAVAIATCPHCEGPLAQLH